MCVTFEITLCVCVGSCGALVSEVFWEREVVGFMPDGQQFFIQFAHLRRHFACLAADAKEDPFNCFFHLLSL